MFSQLITIVEKVASIKFTEEQRKQMKEEVSMLFFEEKVIEKEKNEVVKKIENIEKKKNVVKKVEKKVEKKDDKKNEKKKTFTLTFGDQAENHAGMQKLGVALVDGLSCEDVIKIGETFFKGYEVEQYRLHDLLDEEKRGGNEAVTIVVRGGLAAFFDNGKDGVNEFYEEQDALEKDSKAKMYGRVVDKHARHNLCFGDCSQKANFEEGKGTIVNFEDVACLKKVRDGISGNFGEKCKNLVAEGNYYYDATKCGIGYHGDSERRIVIGARMGEEMPLHFRWYHNGEVVSKTLKLSLGHGDVYISSQKAVGFDWKKKSLYTLRHSAGNKKFLDEANDME